MKIKIKLIYIVLCTVMSVLALVLIWNEYQKTSDKYIFTRVYETKLWGEGSGDGSDPSNAKPYLRILQSYFNDPAIHTILDLGCGDWRLMETIDIPNDKNYKGVDLVGSVINDAKNKHKKPNVEFEQINRLEDLKGEKADLIVIKDVMQHWPNERIIYFIKNILPQYKYALITNDYSKDFHDIKMGEHRSFDIENKMFNIKDNLKILYEYIPVPGREIPKKIYLYTNPNFN